MMATFGTPCIVNDPSAGCPADAVCVSLQNADRRAHHLVVPAEHVADGILLINRYGGNRSTPRPSGLAPIRADGAELVNLCHAALDTNPASDMVETWCLHLQPERIVPFLGPKP